ncbi:MAG: response regulator [bacterium]|nr:response regulator [bacterium]
MKILIVEDDPTAAQFFSQAAQTRGYSDIDIAESAEEALAFLVHNPYDLITLDILLPGASGLEILSVIRSICPQTIIAIISGHLSDDSDHDAVAFADTALSKPVSLDVLQTLFDSSARIKKEMETIKNLSELDTEEA